MVEVGDGGRYSEVKSIGSMTEWMRGVRRDPFWVEDGFKTRTERWL